LLSAAGQIADVYLPTDRATGRPRGFAFVEFSSEAEAQAAIEQFNDYELGGRKIRINAAEDRPQRASNPGRFRPSAPPPGPGFLDRSGKPFKNKGSRRGIRGRKRSL